LRKSFKVAVAAVLLLGLAVVVALGFFLRVPYKGFREEERFLVIPRGTSSLEISRQLERDGIVRSWALFLGYVNICRWSHSLQAGEYRFAEKLTIPQVADKLVRGLVYYHEVTIPEGFSIFDIAGLVAQKGLASPESFRNAVKDSRLLDDLVPDARGLEGFLFPDTYRFPRSLSADEMAHQMVDRFRQMHSRHFEADVKKSSMSLREVITLASLVEKETGIDEERQLVSSVFHNRLKRHIPLQCDPTVIYAARLRGTFHGEISQADLEMPSPYNTYIHSGLPPGPIANPGLCSILAALEPASTDYLYFVSDNRGHHVFSSTLEQHSRAVAAYRRESRKVTQQKPGKS
jgi:UPF0755 protein